MTELIKLGVNGIISDRPDLLFEAVAGYDVDGDGRAGDLLDSDGLIDSSKFDVQAHRGGRDLRPENTLPAMEAGLDARSTTLETDCGLSADNVPVLYHDRVFRAGMNSSPCASGPTSEGPSDSLFEERLARVRMMRAGKSKSYFLLH